MVHSDRDLLRHFLAAIAYRTQKSLRGAPPDFPGFSAGGRTRTPVEILRHMTSVLGYAGTFFAGGAYPVHPEPLPTFAEEIERFHAMVTELGSHLSGETRPQGISIEQLLQGPLADVMTHVGQLALLRRLAGAPVAPENFIFADVQPGRLGPDQPLPAHPDLEWPEGPG
jgi:hypothetical protein